MFISKLIEILRGKRVFIQTHNFPDPDAAASAYGLQIFLSRYGIESQIVYDGKISKISLLRMLEIFGIDMIHVNEADIHKSDSVVIVDAQKSNSNISECEGNVVACIDHHPTFVKKKYRYSDIRLVGACSSIIASYFCEEHEEISPELASALLYGIKIDTDDLARGVKDFDIDMYCTLYKIADKEMISSLIMNRIELNDLRAYGAAIQNIVVNQHIGFAEIPFDCPDSLIAMISDFLLDIDVVAMSVVYSRRRDGLKFSVRSKIPKLVNAGKLTQLSLESIGGSGGGHPTMAGGFIPYKVSGSVNDISQFVQKRFTENIIIDDDDLKNKKLLKSNYTA